MEGRHHPDIPRELRSDLLGKFGRNRECGAGGDRQHIALPGNSKTKESAALNRETPCLKLEKSNSSVLRFSTVDFRPCHSSSLGYSRFSEILRLSRQSSFDLCPYTGKVGFVPCLNECIGLMSPIDTRSPGSDRERCLRHQPAASVCRNMSKGHFLGYAGRYIRRLPISQKRILKVTEEEVVYQRDSDEDPGGGPLHAGRVRRYALTTYSRPRSALYALLWPAGAADEEGVFGGRIRPARPATAPKASERALGSFAKEVSWG
jgi:hypothetical protein